MRLFRPRFTIRQILIAIADITCVLSGIATSRRGWIDRDRYRQSLELTRVGQAAGLDPEPFLTRKNARET